MKTLFYEQTLSLQQENERFYSSLSEQTDSIAKQKEERILFYEKKLEVRGGGEGGEEGEGGEGGGYDEGFLERYRKRREEGREVREREVGEVRERVREKRRGMEERRGEVERQVGIVAKSEEGIRGEKGVVCGVVKGVGGWVGGVGERCRLLQSKLVEVCGEGGGGWGGMLDDEEQVSFFFLPPFFPLLFPLSPFLSFSFFFFFFLLFFSFFNYYHQYHFDPSLSGGPYASGYGSCQ